MPAPPPRLAYVRWLDSCYREGEGALEDYGTGIELEYFGVLVKESEETFTLSLEVPHEGRTRNAFDILKRNVLEARFRDARGAFKAPRKKARKEDARKEEEKDLPRGGEHGGREHLPGARPSPGDEKV